MALPVVTFSSLDEAEDLRQGRAPDQVVFTVYENTSLANANEIKLNTFAGVAGFRVLNPEFLDCKYGTRVELEGAYMKMLEACTNEYNQQMLALDANIARLRLNMITPNHQIPHQGPPVEQRNRGIQQVLYLPPPTRTNEYRSYEYGVPIPYQQPFNNDVERALAIERDRLSQKAWWNINLTFLETKRKILEEKQIDLERQLTAVMKSAIESESHLGSGYADHSFLHC